ncbi:MAG: hypothetical protein KAR05_05290 [Candidatus Omnitrophica bacterium]|nr:hypothetical protein [Candidatus Omnitrophota bacterium]
MNREVKRVLQFFNNEIKDYVIGDLDRLSAIRPDKKTGLRGCSIPQAMLIFAILDLFGYLVNEDPNVSKKATLKNYKVIFSAKLGLFPAHYEKEAKKNVELFRHGVMHQFFAKASGVAKLTQDMPLIHLIDGTPYLNVDRLTEDTINAIRQLRKRIENGCCDYLAKQINKHLDKLAEDDFKELDRHF